VTFVFTLPQEQLRDFKLVPKLIGRRGENTRGVWQLSACKVRIRGLGSGYTEGRTGKEAPIPLQLVLSAENSDDLSAGKRLIAELLRRIEGEFVDYCSAVGFEPPGFIWFCASR